MGFGFVFWGGCLVFVCLWGFCQDLRTESREMLIRDVFNIPDHYLVYHHSHLCLLGSNYKYLLYSDGIVLLHDKSSSTTFGYFVGGPI